MQFYKKNLLLKSFLGLKTQCISKFYMKLFLQSEFQKTLVTLNAYKFERDLMKSPDLGAFHVENLKQQELKESLIILFTS